MHGPEKVDSGPGRESWDAGADSGSEGEEEAEAEAEGASSAQSNGKTTAMLEPPPATMAVVLDCSVCRA